MITGTRTPDNVWRQLRTTSKNTLGYSIIASQKKVDEQREKVMIVKKKDWKFGKENDLSKQKWCKQRNTKRNISIDSEELAVLHNQIGK